MTPRITETLILGLLATVASAFHLPTSRRLAHFDAGKFTHTNAREVVLSLSKENDEDSPRLPFFARTIQKIRSKKDDPESITSSPSDNAADGGDVAVSENPDEEDRVVDSESSLLRALADKTRLEATKMDLSLTLTRIAKLEAKILEIDDKDVRSDLIRDIDILMTKINGPQKTTSNGDITLADGKASPSTSDSKQKDDIKEILGPGEKPLLSDDQRQDAIDAFEKLPQQLRDMMAKSVDIQDGTNATATINKLMAENRLFEGDSEEKFSMIGKAEDFEEIYVDLDIVEINSFVKNMLPEVTRKEPVDMEYVDALYTEVLGKDTFNPRERKPQAVPGGYLIRGESRVKSKEGMDDGDVLIEALDKKISESSVAGKIQAYYILDPRPPSGEEIMNEEDESPVLLITNYDISPDTKVWVKPAVTFLGLASVALFSLGSFSFNDDVMNQISASADAGEAGSLDLLYDLSLPLALSVLGTQILHEAGHLIIAIKDGIQIGLPTFVPGFQIGLTGTITPIKSSPKNIKSLFDFAIAGPMMGLIASVILLYVGLEMTVFMDASAQEQLPSVPVELLRSSALGGGIIEYLLGDGVLNTPDPSTDLIRLHPYALAGFAGLMTNALSLLPIGNTDGGRISVAFFGRSGSRVIQGAAIVGLVVAGFFGTDPVNILLFYAVYSQTWQKEAEVPCRNEVDELDVARGFVAIGMSLVVILTLAPLS